MLLPVLHRRPRRRIISKLGGVFGMLLGASKAAASSKVHAVLFRFGILDEQGGRMVINIALQRLKCRGAALLCSLT